MKHPLTFTHIFRDFSSLDVDWMRSSKHTDRNEYPMKKFTVSDNACSTAKSIWLTLWPSLLPEDIEALASVVLSTPVFCYKTSLLVASYLEWTVRFM